MEYQLAQDTWRDADVISIFDPAGNFLLECPLTFIRKGGVDSWEYILDILSYILAPFSGGCLCSTDGPEVALTSSPKAGEYVFNVDGKPVSCDARPRLIPQTVARSRSLEGPSISGKGSPQTPRRGSRADPDQNPGQPPIKRVIEMSRSLFCAHWPE